MGTDVYTEDAVSFVKSNEGFRRDLYMCSAGKLTIGYGFNIEDRGISERQADLILRDQLIECVVDLREIFPSWYLFTDHRHIALIDMMFNLGRARFVGFRKMIAAIKAHDWGKAADEAKDSRWYNQVGKRGRRVVYMLRVG